jgi:hypothetical protein
MPIVCWRPAREESSPTEKVPSLRSHLAICRALLTNLGVENALQPAINHLVLFSRLTAAPAAWMTMPTI